ncbi:MAG: efflux RND transporter periplasmic adaptor subunit [Alphaproteobacteria bacterium]|nr:efflux RND transporter periplasmic adaptor subunit [Alphaproteobacteria bacterium]
MATRHGVRALVLGSYAVFAVALASALGTAAPRAALAQGAPAASAAPGVVVEKVERHHVRPSIDFSGRVTAVDKGDLRARVTGFLQERLFTEGQDVKVGDLLFSIEKAPYQAEVDQQKAAVAKAQAGVTNAANQLARARDLVKSQNIAQSTVDTRQAEEGQARAELLAAQAALRAAEINLGYTDIKAPIAGRIGQANITVGNLVGPDSGVLATIVSQDPIYVTFPVAQRIVSDYRAKAGRTSDVAVRVRLPNSTLYPQPGKIDFQDVQVAQGTDTVTIRAKLPTPDRILIDGQSVGVVAEADTPELAIVIPHAAIQVDQGGRFVLAVSKENKVEVKRVKATPRRDGTAMVEEGLQEGDLIIVEGLLKVRPGIVVAPTLQPSSVVPRT